MCAEVSQTSEKPMPGLIAGRYEILKPLGRGGMGKVFLVLDHQTGTQCALKMLRAQYVNDERVVERFLREVRAVRQLDHPCIVKILDVQREGNQFFYTMEYLPGKTLRQWLAERGTLAFPSVVRVLCLVAHALEHAHKVTIHRDISPENVMVLPDGSVRLLDFGLAKLADANKQLTMVGVSLGKLQYIAPEQQRDAAHVDHRADIYSLGVMFYELLTGRMPNPQVPLSKLRPDLPPECDEFVRKAMAPDPNQRFNSAAEVHRELLRLYEIYESRPKVPLHPSQNSNTLSSTSITIRYSPWRRYTRKIRHLWARFRIWFRLRNT
jgi:serine/threonine protein kinase